MILPFSTQLNGKPTHFVEKIWEGIFKGIQINYEGLQIGQKALPKNYIINTHKPKLHSFREDKNNRWKSGVMIDFFINTRTKDMFRFAPRIPVVRTQKVEIMYKTAKLEIYIDDKLYSTYCQREKKYDNKLLVLSQNDGFDTVEEFFEYFNTYFSGKIIHWTDLKY